ncbi:hypothetical protein HJFPF1_01047 [Paramyrothecium foliicola]|nr:hypothetical protein HJFPF1_01047 [Paramyrothecium foliicola]
MGGLVGYASSDDEDEVAVKPDTQAPAQAALSAAAVRIEEDAKAEQLEQKSKEAPATVLSQPGIDKVEKEPVVGPLPQNAVPLGPSLPSMDDVAMVSEDGLQAPSSPYSSNRALIQNLTLPTVPNLDIPPSPPGSPPASTTKRFEQFLDLKRKGTHFNSKLENSTALANPSLMDKLMGFVGIEGRHQYQTTLPPDLWNADALPDWAFADKLRKSHDKVVKEREAKQASGGRSSIDFVPSTTQPAGANTPAVGGLSRGEKRKAGWK